MWRTLEKIRRQPKPVKDQYAFVGALILTGLITLIWIASLPLRMNAISTTIAEQEVESTEGIGSIFDGIKSQVANVREALLGPESTESQVTATTTASTTPAEATTTPPANAVDRFFNSVESRDSEPKAPRPIEISTSSRAQNSAASAE